MKPYGDLFQSLLSLTRDTNNSRGQMLLLEGDRLAFHLYLGLIVGSLWLQDIQIYVQLIGFSFLRPIVGEEEKLLVMIFTDTFLVNTGVIAWSGLKNFCKVQDNIYIVLRNRKMILQVWYFIFVQGRDS